MPKKTGSESVTSASTPGPVPARSAESLTTVASPTHTCVGAVQFYMVCICVVRDGSGAAEAAAGEGRWGEKSALDDED
jgi:hypothetical protein